MHGMESTTCTFGTANFTDELFDAIRAAKIESVRLAFDSDKPGETAATKAAERLQAIGIECHQIKFPWGLDANQYALDQGPEALRQAVRNAAWIDAPAAVVAPQKSDLSAVALAKEESAPGIRTVQAASSLAAKPLAANAQPIQEAAKKETFPANPLTKVGEYHEAKFGFENSNLARQYRIGGLEKNH
ncbi:MAG: toprim domain-containing protein, partial [Opitutales bacterium]